jgi:hypothetical protein
MHCTGNPRTAPPQPRDVRALRGLGWDGRGRNSEYSAAGPPALTTCRLWQLWLWRRGQGRLGALRRALDPTSWHSRRCNNGKGTGEPQSQFMGPDAQQTCTVSGGRVHSLTALSPK